MRAQYEIVYLLILVVITIVITASTIFFSINFKNNNAEEIGGSLLDGVATRLEVGLLKLKLISETSSANSLSLELKVPSRIGEQRYTITGLNRTLKLRSSGSPSLVEEREIEFWNATLEGTVFSAKGEVTLTFSPVQNKVSIS